MNKTTKFFFKTKPEIIWESMHDYIESSLDIDPGIFDYWDSHAKEIKFEYCYFIIFYTKSKFVNYLNENNIGKFHTYYDMHNETHYKEMETYIIEFNELNFNNPLDSILAKHISYYGTIHLEKFNIPISSLFLHTTYDNHRISEIGRLRQYTLHNTDWQGT